MSPAEIILGLFAAMLGYRIVKNAATGGVLHAPVFPLEVRVDIQGSGYFGDPRGGRDHQGVDFLCHEGQSVFSPINGTLQRIAYPYADDAQWKGCVIQGEGDDEGLEVKMFYMVPTNPIPRQVRRGEVIGHCQAISKRYTPEMNDHLHVEIREEGTLIDPLPLFTSQAPPPV